MTNRRVPAQAAATGRPCRAARLALASGLLVPLLLPAQAHAFGGGWQPGYRSVPVQSWQPRPVQRSRVVYDSPTQPVLAAQSVIFSAEDRARRCNQGRLLGGLMGGGAGYVLTKGNDRVWATPLGALLGSQMGCNALQGNAPLPW